MLSATLWVVSIIRRDSSIVDPCWGIGFVIVAWVTFWQSSASVDRSQLLLLLVSLWGLRLSGYLTWRNRGKGEDYRYVAIERLPRRSLLDRQFVEGVLAASRHLVVCLTARSIRDRSSGRQATEWVGFDGGGHLATRHDFRDGRRLSAGEFQVKTREFWQSHGSRTVAIHPTSQLLWRFLRLVGILFRRLVRRCGLDDRQPGLHEFLAATRIGSSLARADDCRSSSGLSGIYQANQRILSRSAAERKLIGTSFCS